MRYEYLHYTSELCDELDVHPETRHSTEILVGACDIAGLGQGWKPEAIVAASLHIACRINDEPISLRDIDAHAEPDRKEISTVARKVGDSIDVSLAPERPEIFVDEFIDRLNRLYDSNLGDDVQTTALDLMGETPVGTTPVTKAAAAIYVAADREQKRVTQGEISDVAHVSTTSIRNTAHLIK